MKYLLDTNVCVTFLNQRKPILTKRFLSVPASDNKSEFSRVANLPLEDWEL